MSVAQLERAAGALAPLLTEVVFVGGATITLWITDPGAPEPRPTLDVDVIVQATTRLAQHAFEAKLRELHFEEDLFSGVICRWIHRDSGLILDAMPADASVLGFSNRWQRLALPYAISRELPSGASVKAVSPPYLLATKLEAFNSRGRNDLLGSADFADIVALMDGREEVVDEVAESPADVRAFVADQFDRLLAHPRFLDGLFGALPPDHASQARADAVVRPRMQQIVDLR